ncbi:MAG: hypothetical protein ACP5PZ_11420 [Bacteroidales bacterium]
MYISLGKRVCTSRYPVGLKARSGNGSRTDRSLGAWASDTVEPRQRLGELCSARRDALGIPIESGF